MSANVRRMLRFAFVLSVLVATVWVATASGTPPPASPRVGVSHARPVAGHQFIGFMVTPTTYGITSVNCDANSPQLTGHVRRFYDGGQVVAFGCGWMIPAKAHGMLSATVNVNTSDGGSIQTPVMHWRVKSH